MTELHWLTEEECEKLGSEYEKHGHSFKFGDKWYFSDEAERLVGTFDTKEEADQACEEYARQL